MTFYGPPPGAPTVVPSDVDILVASQDASDRAKRVDYKVSRVLLHDGALNGAYEYFMTGLVGDEKDVWARPVGVAVKRDGALLVTRDDSGLIWHVAYHGH